MMKVPPLIINLKNIEKHKEHKERKKHKKHKKHKRHHHQDKHAPSFTNINPPILDPVELPEIEEPIPYNVTQTATLAPTVPEPTSSTAPAAINEPNVDAPTTIPGDAESTADTTTTTPAAAAAATTTTASDSTITTTTSHDAAIAGQISAVTEADEEPKTNAADPSATDTTTTATISETTTATTTNDTPASPAAVENAMTKANLSYLKLADDGVVRLNIITSLPTEPEDTNERILNLEQLYGELSSGIDVLPSEIDEEECRETMHAKPVESLEPSPFGSYLPAQDSTFANLTKEETETLLEVYGNNDTCYQYAKSLQNYAKGTNYLMTMVDSLLDLLTEGKHRKEVVPVRKKQEEAIKEAQAQEVVTNGQGDSVEGDKGPNGDSTDVKEKVEREEKVEDEVQADLDSIDELLARLKEIQEKRLSSCPAPVEPGEEESRLADEILSKMTKLIKEKTKPQDIIDSKSVFKALGIEMNDCA